MCRSMNDGVPGTIRTCPHTALACTSSTIKPMSAHSFMREVV
ncbi:MAG: hypothetical protein ACYTEO_01445 [Planctomycetota bacterium]